ncbi:MAG TPA: metalloregulator ArsR/SmtB family transcription factor [Candidatus Sulfotelmatobacter sp.]|nr:metalloregulator ArsR/SmtB family transcription factor [Candidatus Sulfotelmatobacter sp.]
MQVISSNSDVLFRILADPTRRLILDLLAERGPLSVGQLASEFPDLVASGISKHLMSLRAGGVVSATRRGRQQIYQLEPDVLAAGLTPWIAKYEQYWSAALERLRDLAQEGRVKDEQTSRKNVRRKRAK